MLFYILSILALLAWSGSDLFSKMGTREQDKNSHWKVVFAVGFIMGIHFFITLIGGHVIDTYFGGPDNVHKVIASLFYTDFVFYDFIRYLPVAGLYILAMVFGYIGLRYIELSISSPICNCSGALAFILCAIVGLISKERYEKFEEKMQREVNNESTSKLVKRFRVQLNSEEEERKKAIQRRDYFRKVYPYSSKEEREKKARDDKSKKDEAPIFGEE